MSYFAIGGAGDFAREVRQWIHDAGHGVGAFTVTEARFVPEGGRYDGLPVLVLPSANLRQVGPLVMGTASWATKAALAALLAQWQNAPLAPAVIHPRATVGQRVALGAGSIVCPGAIITVDCQIGRGLTMNLGATIGHDCTVGDWVNLSPGAKVSGRCRIGDCVDIGTNATVIPGIRIAKGAIIGAGAVVTRDITEAGTYVGVPARCVRRS